MPDSNDNTALSLPSPPPAFDAERERTLALERSRNILALAIPIVPISLDASEKPAVNLQQARHLLGPVGSAPMNCENLCPFRGECSLFQIGKHPVGSQCPFEAEFLQSRILGWLGDLNTDLESATASERFFISSIAALELELNRVRRILARPENAEMNQLSVRDVNAENNEPICWENVIHTAAQREDQILISIRMLMKDFELTPEQQTKRAKALGIRSGNNMAVKQSSIFDRIRESNNRPPVDVSVESTPAF